MKKATKKYPLCIGIKGHDVRKATMFGLAQYMRSVCCDKATLEFYQNEIQVKHQYTGAIINVTEKDHYITFPDAD